MKQFLLYDHDGVYNHGVEAITKTTVKEEIAAGVEKL